jgi:hypothetical protein
MSRISDIQGFPKRPTMEEVRHHVTGGWGIHGRYAMGVGTKLGRKYNSNERSF